MKKLLVAAFACMLGISAIAAVEGNNTAVVIRKKPVVSDNGYQYLCLPVRGFDITGAEILDPAAYEGNIHVVACDDALHLEDTHGTKMRFDYADLRVVYPTSEFVVAGFGGKRYVYVPRSALSEGRFRELVRILDAHCK